MEETTPASTKPLFFKGDLVRVRPMESIISTLDEKGTLEALPFMPEMKQFCGKEFRVFCRLEKTCVEGYGARTLPNTLILEGVRCNGAAHDGCQRACTLLWKEAWLEAALPETHLSPALPSLENAHPSSVSLVTKTNAGQYFCQSTELSRASRYLFPLSFRRVATEYLAKNVDLQRAVQFIWKPLVVKIKTKLFGRSAVQPVGPSKKTPTESLNLQPGEWVEVKSAGEISATLDTWGSNRGLSFSPQMLPFCGKKYLVRGRIERAILETTGRMSHLKDTVLLETATCDGHTILGGCSRDIHHYWREIWLRRTTPPGS